MASAVQQLVALLGVLLGAAATYVVTRANERERWQRERGGRLDQRRMDAYAEYAQAIKRITGVAVRVAVGRGLEYEIPPLPIDEGADLLTEAEFDRASKWEGVLLLGDSKTIAAAREWHRCAWRLEWFARGKLPTEQDEWKQALKDNDKARAAFYRCARRDLGVDGEIPETVWPVHPVGWVLPEGRDVAQA